MRLKIYVNPILPTTDRKTINIVIEHAIASIADAIFFSKEKVPISKLKLVRVIALKYGLSKYDLLCPGSNAPALYQKALNIKKCWKVRANINKVNAIPETLELAI